LFQVIPARRSKDYVRFPDEGHGFRKTPNRITANVAVVPWFVKYLKL